MYPRSLAARLSPMPMLALSALVISLAGTATADPPVLKTESIAVHTAKGVARFTVEVADTEPTRERGLMFRKSVGADQGMIFEFSPPEKQWFWMKNTLIPLDIIYILPNGRIASIARNAVPLDETPIPSGVEVSEVLELRGGRAAEIGAEPGDLVTTPSRRE